MRLVDDAFVVRDVRRPVVRPVEVRVDDHATHRVRGRVAVLAGAPVVELVAEHGLVPVEGAGHRLGVRVEQQFVRVAADAALGLVRPVHPVAVFLARPRCPAGNRARRTRRPRSGRRGFRCRPARTGTPRRGRRPGSTARSWCRCRHSWRRADTRYLATAARVLPSSRCRGRPGSGPRTDVMPLASVGQTCSIVAQHHENRRTCFSAACRVLAEQRRTREGRRTEGMADDDHNGRDRRIPPEVEPGRAGGATRTVRRVGGAVARRVRRGERREHGGDVAQALAQRPPQ